MKKRKIIIFLSLDKRCKFKKKCIYIHRKRKFTRWWMYSKFGWPSQTGTVDTDLERNAAILQRRTCATNVTRLLEKMSLGNSVSDLQNNRLFTPTVSWQNALEKNEWQKTMRSLLRWSILCVGVRNECIRERVFHMLVFVFKWTMVLKSGHSSGVGMKNIEL